MNEQQSAAGTDKHKRSILTLVAVLSVFIVALSLANIIAVGGFDQGQAGYILQGTDLGRLGGMSSSDIYAGFRFSPKIDGFVTELCGYFYGTKSVDLYNSDFELLDSAPVSSDGGWNCAPIGGVAVRQGRDYFVVGEMDGGAAYYRYEPDAREFLPVTTNRVEIKSGVRQSLAYPFGTAVKSYADHVFGLVDIKLGADAPLQDAVAKGKIKGKTGANTIKNCAGQTCIICVNNDCVARTGSDGAGKAAFTQTCVNGYCFNCADGGCVKNAAAGLIKAGLFVKNCIDGGCVNCFNGACGVTGSETGAGTEYACKTSCGSLSEAVAGPPGVWGGCQNNRCGEGGMAIPAAADAPRNNDKSGGYFDNGTKYSIDCDTGVCRLCSGSECTIVSVGKGTGMALQAASQNNNKKKEDTATDESAFQGGGDSAPPLILKPRPSGRIGASFAVLSVETDENAFCKYCQVDSPFAKMCSTFDNTGETVHETAVGPLDEGEYKYYIRCRDRAGNENNVSVEITFETVIPGREQSEAVDIAPPAVVAFGIEPAAARDGAKVTISAGISDRSDIADARVNLRNEAGNIVAVVILHDDGRDGDEFAGDAKFSGEWTAAAGKKEILDAYLSVSDRFGNFAPVSKKGALAVIPGIEGDAPGKNQ